MIRALLVVIRRLALYQVGRIDPVRLQQPFQDLSLLILADHREGGDLRSQAKPGSTPHSPRPRSGTRACPGVTTGTGASGEIRSTCPHQ